MKQVRSWMSNLLSFRKVFHQSLLFHCNAPRTTGRWHLCWYLQIMAPDLIEGALSSASFLEGHHQTHVGEVSPPCSINELGRSYSSFLRLTCFLQQIRSCSSNSSYRLLIMMWFGGWHRVGSRILLYLKHSTAVDETIIVILIANLFSLVHDSDHLIHNLFKFWLDYGGKLMSITRIFFKGFYWLFRVKNGEENVSRDRRKMI